MLKLGLLHPGAMGISVAASAQNSQCEVYWASEGRSQETDDRAAKFKLHDSLTLAVLCETCSILVSVCPPHAAEEMASQVAALGFKGFYLDANAISPQRAMRIGQNMSQAGITFIDGSIIGGPAWEPNKTWLYLSGKEAEVAAQCFTAGPLETTIIGDEIGQASAIKMCYAAYTKGTIALLSAIAAAADNLGVWEALQTQWSRNWPKFDEQTNTRIQRVTAKAWRFAGEMEEIAATFEEAGLPTGFSLAAADIYQRTAHFKGAEPLPEVAEILKVILEDE